MRRAVRAAATAACAVAATMCAFVGTAVPAHAGAMIQPGGTCFGVDHFPEPNPFGSPSLGIGGFALPPQLAGRDVLLATNHPAPDGRPSVGTATVGDDGLVFVQFPLYQYGSLDFTYAGVGQEGHSFAGGDPYAVDDSKLTRIAVESGPYEVGDEEPPCDATQLEPVIVSISSTTTTFLPPFEGGTDAPGEALIDPDPAGSSRPVWPWVALGSGLVLVVGGFVISRTGVRKDVASTPGPAVTTREDPTRRRSVIFVPGIMASALTTRVGGVDHQVWPPIGFAGDAERCLNTLQAVDATKLSVDAGSNTGLLPGIHTALLTLLDSMGYSLSASPPNLYVHSYNWMLSCEEAGRSLAKLINEAEATHGTPPTIIAHSMGGLVTRAAFHIHGATNVDQVYFIGSPHYGAPMTYFSLHPDIPYQFLPGAGGAALNAAYATATATRRRYASGDPSTLAPLKYQALGTAVSFVTELATGNSLFDDVLQLVSQNALGVFELLPDEDYFSVIHHGMQDYIVKDVTNGTVPLTWQECYLGPGPWALPGHLQGKINAAMAFKAKIRKPLPPTDPSKCHVIYGAKHPTPTEALLTPSASGIEAEVTTGDHGGDATVPKESGRGDLLCPPAANVHRDDGAEHFMLTETGTVKMILETTLPRADA